MQDKIIAAIAAYLDTKKIRSSRINAVEEYFPQWPLEKATIATEIAAAIAPHLPPSPKFHDPFEHPIRVEGEEFSVDVFILDETGVHGIAFWNFDDKVWRFHTDTLVDYNEPNAETKWKWYYPPYDLDQVFNR